jgi:hypothetical protein
MSVASQRDVALTPFMLRVRAVLAGEDTSVALRVQPSARRKVAEAAWTWVSCRARAEQVIAEANSMLAGVDLEDEVGKQQPTFVLRRESRWARVSMLRDGTSAWLQPERSYWPGGSPVEAVDAAVLEDLIVELLFLERRKGHG